jgi:predicted dehydrogenase
MRKHFRAGLIGCGALGKVHAECVAQLDGMEMVAFCDCDPARAEALRKAQGGEYATPDALALIEDHGLDVIYIATWHDSHAGYCIRAAEAGKHILVEKPLALSVEECRAIGQAVHRNGVKLFTAFKMRYYDLILKARELIPQPVLVSMQMMDNRWADDHWASDPVRGGGNVLSQGCHSCDILRFVAGSEPTEVFAAGGNYYTATGVVDNLCATFRFASGAAGNWIQGDASCPPLTSKFFMQVFAEGRSITLSDRLTTLTYREGQAEPRVFRGSETGFLAENRAFLDCLIHDRPPAIDHVDGLTATLMVLQALRSLRTGRPEPIAALVRESQGDATE